MISAKHIIESFVEATYAKGNVLAATKDFAHVHKNDQWMIVRQVSDLGGESRYELSGPLNGYTASPLLATQSELDTNFKLVRKSY